MAARSRSWTWPATLGGLAATLVWGAVVVWLDEGGHRRGETRLELPPAGTVATVLPGQHIEVAGSATGREGCSVSSPDQNLPIVDGAFAGQFRPPGPFGERLLWLRVACDGEERERFARRLEVWPAEPEPESLVARVFLHAEVIQNLLRERLPPPGGDTPRRSQGRPTSPNASPCS